MPFELGYLTDFIRQTQDQSLKLIADHALGGRRAMLKPKPANANLDTLLRNANDTTCAVAVEGALRIGLFNHLINNSFRIITSKQATKSTISAKI